MTVVRLPGARLAANDERRLAVARAVLAALSTPELRLTLGDLDWHSGSEIIKAGLLSAAVAAYAMQLEGEGVAEAMIEDIHVLAPPGVKIEPSEA